MKKCFFIKKLLAPLLGMTVYHEPGDQLAKKSELAYYRNNFFLKFSFCSWLRYSNRNNKLSCKDTTSHLPKMLPNTHSFLRFHTHPRLYDFSAYRVSSIYSKNVEFSLQLPHSHDSAADNTFLLSFRKNVPKNERKHSSIMKKIKAKNLTAQLCRSK